MPEKILDRALETEISEIFSSLQGEGPYVGTQQVFVRFGRCNMRCVYCDEADKMKEGAFRPYSLEEVLGEIERFQDERGAHHSVSLTGGEPLFYVKFLKNLLPAIRRRGLKTYLETNGTLPRELASVIDWCDIIAMDLKPPSSTGERDFWAEHESFLRIAFQKEVFVKVVVTPQTTPEDIRRCVAIVKNSAARIPFIFQPESEAIGISTAALRLIENHFFSLAKEHLHDVRVIPQMHKIWGVR